MSNLSRRSFFSKTAVAGFAALTTSKLVLGSKIRSEEKGLTFLFQGDSITDGNRGRNDDPNHIMGHGYAFSIASRAGATYPREGLIFLNRGISGNTVWDLSKRWQKDTINLKPDVLSILVGINDADRALREPEKHTIEDFHNHYRELLISTLATAPDCKLVLCQPFYAPVGRVKENWSAWQKEVESRQKVVHLLSKEFNTIYVPFQEAVNAAILQAPVEYWIWDGIHPTVAGHEILAREWMKRVSRHFGLFKKLL